MAHNIDDNTNANNNDVFMEQLEHMAQAAGFHMEQVVDAAKIARVLEAVAGHAETAAQLYWDDFLATRARENNQDEQNDEEMDDEDDEEMEDAAAMGLPEEREDDEEEEEESSSEEEPGEEPRLRNDDDDEAPPEAVPQPQQQPIHSDDESVPKINGDPSIAVQLRRRLFVRRKSRRRKSRRFHRRSVLEDSVVSNDDDDDDDEQVIGSSERKGGDAHKKKTKSSRETSPVAKRRKIENAKDDGYLSDNDWLWDDAQGTQESRCQRLLWGAPQPPATWRRAGLTVCKTTGAVVLYEPNEKDEQYTSWTEGHKLNVPPPYHCRSMTVVTSVLTALLYSGATLQPGPGIGVSRKPLVEILDKLDTMHPRELSNRLVDAITILLYIAATASRDRKLLALERMGSELDPTKLNHMRRRLDVVPAQDSGYTHIVDINNFVRSHIQEYTASGGVAALMETFLRMHGRGAVRRCWPTSCMIECTCQQRFADQDNHNALKVQAKKNPHLDTTPRDLQCLAGNDRLLADWLLSGLVLGDGVHDGWQQLGVGLLTLSKRENLDTSKVWLVQGPTQWSVLVRTDRMDDPTVCAMKHINTWYDNQHVTSVHITRRNDDTPLLCEESSSFTVHEQDQTLYPHHYRLWRYTFNDGVYCPFHALTQAQQSCIEQQQSALTKLLQHHWPGARVQQGKDAVV